MLLLLMALQICVIIAFILAIIIDLTFFFVVDEVFIITLFSALFRKLFVDLPFIFRKDTVGY